MDDIVEFAKQYHQALHDLTDAIPKTSRNSVPACIVSPSFIILSTGADGSVSLELRSREACPVLHINGGEATPLSSYEPGIIATTLGTPISDFLFPGVPHNTKSIFNVETHLHLVGLSFASEAFKKSLLGDSFHINFVGFPGAELPFTIGGNGVLLCVNIVHGYLGNGTPQIRAFEWLKLFSSGKMIPREMSSVRELALRGYPRSMVTLQGCT